MGSKVKVEVELTLEEYLKVLEAMSRLGLRNFRDLLLYFVDRCLQ